MLQRIVWTYKMDSSALWSKISRITHVNNRFTVPSSLCPWVASAVGVAGSTVPAIIVVMVVGVNHSECRLWLCLRRCLGGVQQGLGDGLNAHDLLLHVALHRHQPLLKTFDRTSKFLVTIVSCMYIKMHRFKKRDENGQVKNGWPYISLRSTKK